MPKQGLTRLKKFQCQTARIPIFKLKIFSKLTMIQAIPNLKTLNNFQVLGCGADAPLGIPVGDGFWGYILGTLLEQLSCLQVYQVPSPRTMSLIVLVLAIFIFKSTDSTESPAQELCHLQYWIQLFSFLKSSKSTESPAQELCHLQDRFEQALSRSKKLSSYLLAIHNQITY